MFIKAAKKRYFVGRIARATPTLPEVRHDDWAFRKKLRQGLFGNELRNHLIVTEVRVLSFRLKIWSVFLPIPLDLHLGPQDAFDATLKRPHNYKSMEIRTKSWHTYARYALDP